VGMDWIELPQDKDRWRTLVREVEESGKVDPERKEPVKCEELLEGLTASFSGIILLNGFFS